MLIGISLLGSAPLALLLMLVMGRDEKSTRSSFMHSHANHPTIHLQIKAETWMNLDDGEGLNDAAGMNANALHLQPSWLFSQGLMLALMLKPLLLMLAYGGGMPTRNPWHTQTRHTFEFNYPTPLLIPILPIVAD
ncbi:hypothetical protein ARMGADRAFT_1028394 [Armillaria gallica]|uniref:Uncharacterized protein n=1 Tax=Armillaria gallica TaxID=47427 RepID=A0A2H3E6L0_ARMGA|nr:hypothetical protein ARMGADRAFT_1028394 [Armillaria gallica]